MEKDVASELLSNAKYVVHISVSEPALFDKILSGIFVREYGYAFPAGVTVPAVKGKDDEVKLFLEHGSLSYGHAASRFGISYRYYREGVQSIISSLSKKEVVDKHVNEAIDLYLKQKNEKPKVVRKIKSEIEL